jgi:hypothetical protein
MVTWIQKSANPGVEGGSLPKNLLPGRYGKFGTSELTARIDEGDNQLPVFTLKP